MELMSTRTGLPLELSSAQTKRFSVCYNSLGLCVNPDYSSMVVLFLSMGQWHVIADIVSLSSAFGHRWSFGFPLWAIFFLKFLD